MSNFQNHSLQAPKEHALKAIAQSALYRRKVNAFYAAVNVGEQRSARLIVFLAAISCIGIFSVKARSIHESTSRAVPIRLAETTRANQFDRFNVVHTIHDGDTIWGMTTQYYGSYSDLYQRRLREMNPWLPQDPKQLKIGLTIKIPVM